MGLAASSGKIGLASDKVIEWLLLTMMWSNLTSTNFPDMFICGKVCVDMMRLIITALYWK